jgi:hypothetical protein
MTLSVRVELLQRDRDAAALRAALIDADLNRRILTGEVHTVVVPPFLARDAVARFARHAKVHSVAGHPLGWSKPTFKAIEATGLAKENVDAVEVVPLPDVSTLLDELREIVRGVRAARPGLCVLVRVSPVLIRASGEGRSELIVRAVQQSGCDGVVLTGPDEENDEANDERNGDMSNAHQFAAAHLIAAIESAGLTCVSSRDRF